MTQRRSLLALAAVIVFTLSSHAQAALVGLWRFNDNTDDSSGFGNNGTLQNGAAVNADNSPVGGGSLFVNGGTQHMSVAHDNTLNIVGQGTFAAWVRTVGNIQWDGVLAKNPSNGSATNHAGNYELRIENGSRVPTFLYQQGGGNDTAAVNTPTAIANDVWTHVAVTTQASGLATFYINGNQVSTAALNQNFGATNFNPLLIGTRADLFTVMNGRLDDVAVFDQVLTPAQIQTIRTGDFSAFTNNQDNPQIITGVTVTASSQLLGGFNRAAVNVVNGAGFAEASGHHSNGLENVHWLNVGNTGAFGTPDVNPFITFDLGEVMRVQDMLIWNYNEADAVLLTSRGINQATVQVSTDGVFFTDLFTTNLTQAPGTTNVDYHQTLELNTTARFIRLTNLTNHGGDNGFVGLSEVRFVEAIPEPATLGLLGLAGLSLTLRRRRNA